MTENSSYSPNFVIPIGTQVVLKRDLTATRDGEAVMKRAGSVGEVTEQPSEDSSHYALRFTDGALVRVDGADLVIRKQVPVSESSQVRSVDEYEPHLILRAAVGSQAYGLATSDSDADEKGIFLPPADWTWSLDPVPEQVEFKRTPDGEVVLDRSTQIDGDDFCWWELEKFLRLALRANPTALEVLFVPERCLGGVTELGRKLLAIRESFLSRFIYQTYSGYALSQFRRMQRARRAGQEPRAKHAMHLIRLLLSGIAGLRTGVIQVDVSDRRDELLPIKTGAVAFEDVHARALELDAEFQEAFATSQLPDRPDTAIVDKFLIEARRSAV